MFQQTRKGKGDAYKIAACFDIETSNNANFQAEPVSYQLSRLINPLQAISELDNDAIASALDITIDRDYKAVYKRFDDLIDTYRPLHVIPVVLVHNLAFEMWALSPYINTHTADCCAKSTVKPITINIKDDEGKPLLVFWDTLSFSGKSLDTLGNECGYPKLTGTWDYLKKRTTKTPLTEQELAYAREDVIVPWAWLAYHLKLVGVDEDKLAVKILTKTSEVRYKVERAVGGKLLAKNCTISKDWARRNQEEQPKTDDLLFTIHAGTRGGYTYASRRYAAVVFRKTEKKRVYKFDAASMHPFHALAHYVPSNYRPISTEKAEKLARFVMSRSVADVLADYAKPFCGALFYAAFRFSNVRLKAGSLFARDEVTSFTAARFRMEREPNVIEENEGGQEFKIHMYELGYMDKATNDAEFAFGKFYGASEVVLWLNELSAWEFSRQFDYDEMECIGHAYGTGALKRPTVRSVMAFNQYYKEKSQFKIALHQYEHGEPVGRLGFVPEYLMNAMEQHDEFYKSDARLFYMSKKGDLNSLYGIEATNEAKPEIVLTKEGLQNSDAQGVEALPYRPKTWFQYGSHIVGWSRIHQIIFMELLYEKTDAIFINGDTDSHKVYTSATLDEINEAIAPLHSACAKSVNEMRSILPDWYEWYPMDGLGYYECEGEPDAFTASWNKCYMELEGGKISMTIAGVPCQKRFTMPDGSVIDHSYQKVAEWMLANGYSFEEIAGLLIGYNVSVSSNITGMNARTLPKWNTFGPDGQPCAIHLGPMLKTLGDTTKAANFTNASYATRNNPGVNTESKIIDWPLDVDEPIIMDL